MFEFVSGPLFWISLAICVAGSIYKLIHVIKLAKKDKVVLPYMRLSYSLKSLAHWVVPFGTRSMRIQPLFTVVAFSFHLCLLFTPLLLLAHQQLLGIGFFHIPDAVAHFLTAIVIIGGLFFLQRRLLVPYVNNVTYVSDILLLLLVMAPFVTGFLAYYQWFDYRTVITLHMISGCVMLIIIPFTRIAHMLFFVLTRSYMACEFGYVRNSQDW
jgi:nitrate reductase gamma subunit